MSVNLVQEVSLFTDFLEFDLGIPDIEDIEPDDIKVLCDDPIFRKVCDYCRRTRQSRNSGCDKLGDHDGHFDRDELGIDPREDYDAATDL